MFLQAPALIISVHRRKAARERFMAESLKFVVTSGVVEYAFDSGADDYGWRINPDYDSYWATSFRLPHQVRLSR